MILIYIKLRIQDLIEVVDMIDNLNLYERAVQALNNNDIGVITSISKELNLDFADSGGETLLWKAVQKNSIGVVEALLKAGANINIPDKAGWSPLHIAVQNQDINMVDLLLRYAPEINAQNKHGNTAIWIAVYYAKGQEDIINLLLDSGADPYQKNNTGINAIQLAQLIANYDNLSIFKRRGILK